MISDEELLQQFRALETEIELIQDLQTEKQDARAEIVRQFTERHSLRKTGQILGMSASRVHQLLHR